MISCIYEILKRMIQMKLFIKQKQTIDIDNKLMATKAGSGWRNKLGAWD